MEKLNVFKIKECFYFQLVFRGEIIVDPNGNHCNIANCSSSAEVHIQCNIIIEYSLRIFNLTNENSEALS